MSISVRRATGSDADHLVHCNRQLAAETENLDLDRDVVSAGVRAALDDENKGFYLIAEADGVLAGALLVTYEWSDWRNGWLWWIQSVYVLPQHRRRGVYRALHTEVVALARARGGVRGIRLYVVPENERAQTTYTAMGMSPAGYEIFEQDL